MGTTEAATRNRNFFEKTHDEAFVAHARALWAEGHSTAEIGRRMGVTKNVIVGVAHRNEGFPPRPSPIGSREH